MFNMKHPETIVAMVRMKKMSNHGSRSHRSHGPGVESTVGAQGSAWSKKTSDPKMAIVWGKKHHHLPDLDKKSFGGFQTSFQVMIENPIIDQVSAWHEAAWAEWASIFLGDWKTLLTHNQRMFMSSPYLVISRFRMVTSPWLANTKSFEPRLVALR